MLLQNFSIFTHIAHLWTQSLLTADRKNTICIQKFVIGIRNRGIHAGRF